MPPLEAPAAVRAAFYAEQAANPAYAWSRLLIMAQLAPLALLFGGLYAVLRRAEGGSGALATAVLTVGVVGAVLAPVVAAIGAIVALAKDCTIEVERAESTSTTDEEPRSKAG